MIIGQIIGGLGNQMFQYAFYKYLAFIKNSELKLDLTLFDVYKLHNGYELKGIFGIDEVIAANDELEMYKSKYSLLFKIENKIFNKNVIFGKKHFKENKFYIDEKIFDKNINDFYVEGYFQTYKYIQTLGENIFQFRTALSDEEDKLLQGNVISIHIRGGDYITRKKDNKLFGNICTIEYYQNAIKYIKENVQKPVFLVFTNDKEYAVELLHGESFQIVDGNSGKNSFRDMYLMSQCKHNIIANSSFSWWGAWLNKNDSKIVIAPTRWFNDDSIDQSNIVPSSWIKVSSL